MSDETRDDLLAFGWAAYQAAKQFGALGPRWVDAELLAAILFELEQTGWRPIKEAPKDERVVDRSESGLNAYELIHEAMYWRGLVGYPHKPDLALARSYERRAAALLGPPPEPKP